MTLRRLPLIALMFLPILQRKLSARRKTKLDLTKRAYRDVLDGQTFNVETGRWCAEVIAEPAVQTYPVGEYVDYTIEFTDGRAHLKLKLSVLSGYLRRPDLHPLVRDWIESWLEDPERDEELIIGPPI